MAAALYLVSKGSPENPDNTIINGVHAMVVNADDGGSDAVIIAEAEATAVAQGHPLPSGYFDTVQLLGVPTGGIIATDEEAVIFGNRWMTIVT